MKIDLTELTDAQLIALAPRELVARLSSIGTDRDKIRVMAASSTASSQLERPTSDDIERECRRRIVQDSRADEWGA